MPKNDLWVKFPSQRVFVVPSYAAMGSELRQPVLCSRVQDNTVYMELAEDIKLPARGAGAYSS